MKIEYDTEEVGGRGGERGEKMSSISFPFIRGVQGLPVLVFIPKKGGRASGRKEGGREGGREG